MARKSNSLPMSAKLVEGLRVGSPPKSRSPERRNTVLLTMRNVKTLDHLEERKSGSPQRLRLLKSNIFQLNRNILMQLFSYFPLEELLSLRLMSFRTNNEVLSYMNEALVPSLRLQVAAPMKGIDADDEEIAVMWAKLMIQELFVPQETSNTIKNQIIKVFKSISSGSHKNFYLKLAAAIAALFVKRPRKEADFTPTYLSELWRRNQSSILSDLVHKPWKILPLPDAVCELCRKLMKEAIPLLTRLPNSSKIEVNELLKHLVSLFGIQNQSLALQVLEKHRCEAELQFVESVLQKNAVNQYDVVITES